MGAGFAISYYQHHTGVGSAELSGGGRPAANGDRLFAEAGFPGLLRHYGMTRFYKKFRPHLAWEQMAIQNLVDQSGLAIFRLSYRTGLGIPLLLRYRSLMEKKKASLVF